MHPLLFLTVKLLLYLGPLRVSQLRRSGSRTEKYSCLAQPRSTVYGSRVVQLVLSLQEAWLDNPRYTRLV